MKKLLSMAAVLSGLLFVVSCDDDDDDTTPADAGITISGIPATASIDNLGTLGPVTATIDGADGVASFTASLGGNNIVDTTFADSPAQATVSFSYTAAEADADQNLVFTFTATDADGDTDEVTHVLSVGEAPEVVVPQDIVHVGILDADETWTADNYHILGNRVVVPNGVTLTIMPGTIVKGETGEGSLASALVVARGGTIIADGDPDNDGTIEPIIFTSVTDDLAYGDTDGVGSNLEETDNGLWGGLLILGNAPISADAEAVQIEGIPADETYGLYGGTNATDNSGTLRYVSVRHGGSLIGEGNEINGITLGGVGSGTTIEYVEVVANKDDGIEWFGGTVDVTNALVWAADDDAIDVDQAWSGTLDNFIVIAFGGTDHGLEIDGPEGAGTGQAILTNGSIKGVDDEMADFRDGATAELTSTYFFNFMTVDGEGDFEIDADGSDDPNSADPTDPDAISNNPAGSDNYAGGSLDFTGNEFNTTATLEDIFSDKWSVAPSFLDFLPNDTRTDADATTQAAANEAKFVSENAVVTSRTNAGADASAFAGWTMADAKGQLADF